MVDSLTIRQNNSHLIGEIGLVGKEIEVFKGYLEIGGKRIDAHRTRERNVSIFVEDEGKGCLPCAVLCRRQIVRLKLNGLCLNRHRLFRRQVFDTHPVLIQAHLSHLHQPGFLCLFRLFLGRFFLLFFLFSSFFAGSGKRD